MHVDRIDHVAISIQFNNCIPDRSFRSIFIYSLELNHIKTNVRYARRYIPYKFKLIHFVSKATFVYHHSIISSSSSSIKINDVHIPNRESFERFANSDGIEIYLYDYLIPTFCLLIFSVNCHIFIFILQFTRLLLLLPICTFPFSLSR
jgi:hypothetical protein